MSTILTLTTLLVASQAAAQPAMPSHQQHQTTSQHPQSKVKTGCCCDEDMRQMMKTMMQMHQGQGHQPGQKSKHEHQAGTEVPKQQKQ